MSKTKSNNFQWLKLYCNLLWVPDI